MVKSKKQEIFRKLNSTSGISDCDVGKYFISYAFFSDINTLIFNLNVHNPLTYVHTEHAYIHMYYWRLHSLF